MRTLALLGLVLGLLAATTLLTPWIAGALGPGFTFGRVYDRVFEGLLLIGLALTWRRLDLGTARAIGFERRGAGRWLALGLGIGIAGIGVGLVAAWAGGALVPVLRFPGPKTVRKALLGLAAALAIGVGEEALFRGVLLRRLSRDGGRVFGVLVTTAIYAVVHQMRAQGGKGPAGIEAGLARTASLFTPLADPQVWPAVAGLVGLGLLLAAARLQSGTLWLPIGIHAAWVAVFRVGRLFFDLRRWPAWLVGPGWPPIVGGVAGLAALVVTAGLLVRLGRTRLGARGA